MRLRPSNASAPAEVFAGTPWTPGFGAQSGPISSLLLGVPGGVTIGWAPGIGRALLIADQR